tara:strand:- start:493 stop:1554 length:1062 start_codon:yes stop_codon:yes gene_type:complete
MSQVRKDKITKIAWALMTASVQGKLDVPGEYLWNIPVSDDFYEIRSKTWSVFSSGNCIKDKEAIEFVNSVRLNTCLQDPHIVKKYEEYFPVWLKKCSRFQLNGLDDFKHSSLSQGSQEYFINFYLTHRNKRFRILKGEYWWHMEVWKNMGINWEYIENDDIKPNDVVIVSFPFARLGDKHPQLDSILDQCDKIDVPVMLDFIYLPNVNYDNLQIDLTRSCIKSLSFSLSKAYPVANGRVALRMTREKIYDPMQISNDENVANRLAAGLGLAVMKNFKVDYMVEKYQKEQEHWCKVLGLQPTKVVHFALGEPYTENGRQTNKRFFSEFNDQQNRYNLGPLFANKNLLQELGYYE